MKLNVEKKKVKEESSKSDPKVDGSTKMETNREFTEQEMETWREMHDVPSPENGPYWKAL